MDENRAQAYLDLIQQLLNCPNGDEPQILQANSELLDGEFLQICEQVATMLAAQGEENPARFLRNLASQLGEFLGVTSAEGNAGENNSLEDYERFFQLLLQTENENFGGDPRHIYAVLQANLDKLNLNFIPVLQQGMANILGSIDEPEQAETFADLIENIAVRINQFPRGSRADNLEIAIAAYEIVLSVRTRETNREKWAQTQNNLAIAYRNRIRGERADNLEQAIACSHRALEVYTRDAFPEDWAMTQNNLANAYSDRIRGERADNLEQAIACCHRALEVRTREAFPKQWAMTQNNLGEAYRNRIRGERAGNLEQAIACYQSALEVRTRDAFPQDWAQTQNNLAAAYYSRIRGERADNLEGAIACYQSALEVRTREAFPQYWADTQNNLAVAYYSRIRGERADNLEGAIASYHRALEVRTREAFPQYWADTQNNLAVAYYSRIRGERADNLEGAIASYHRALEVYTRDAFPQDWAMTQNNLANAYSDRIRGERADNLEQAIACYQSALEVFTRKAFPEQWAKTQNNLGEAYRNRIRGERADNLKDAIKSYRQALEIRTPAALPLDCLQTGRNLGNLAFELPDWENAIYGYGNAISAVEQSREWATSQRSKRQILQDALPIYELMVRACIAAQRYDTALLAIERSKSRTLIELLDNARLYPANITPSQKQRLDELRRQIASLQQQLDSRETPADGDPDTNIDGNRGTAPATTPAANPEAELKIQQQHLTQLLAEINDPNFNLTQIVKPQLPDFTQLLNRETALIEWYIPPNSESGFYAFIVTLAGDPPKSPLKSYPLVTSFLTIPKLLHSKSFGINAPEYS